MDKSHAGTRHPLECRIGQRLWERLLGENVSGTDILHRSSIINEYATYVNSVVTISGSCQDIHSYISSSKQSCIHKWMIYNYKASATAIVLWARSDCLGVFRKYKGGLGNASLLPLLAVLGCCLHDLDSIIDEAAPHQVITIVLAIMVKI